MIFKGLLVMTLIAVVSFVGWFIRTANGAKGYAREPLPSSVDDYHVRSRHRPTEDSGATSSSAP